jgi:hypothetical protein
MEACCKCRTWMLTRVVVRNGTKQDMFGLCQRGDKNCDWLETHEASSCSAIELVNSGNDEPSGVTAKV